MATIDSSDFSAETGWTVVRTAGSVTFNQVSGDRTYVRCVGASSWNTTGFVRTTPIAGASGHVIYWDYRQPSDRINVFFGGLQDSLTIAYSPMDFANVSGTPSFPRFYLWDGSTQGNFYFPVLGATWFNFKWEILSDGRCSLYVHQDDGTPQDQITSWTLIDTSTVVNSGDYTSKNIYFVGAHYYDTPPALPGYVDISRYYYTNNGYIIDPVEETKGINPGIKWKEIGKRGLKFGR